MQLHSSATRFAKEVAATLLGSVMPIFFSSAHQPASRRYWNAMNMSYAFYDIICLIIFIIYKYLYFCFHLLYIIFYYIIFVLKEIQNMINDGTFITYIKFKYLWIIIYKHLFINK